MAKLSQMPSDPDMAWLIIQSRQNFVEPKRQLGVIESQQTRQRLVCVSDTHGRHRGITLPRGDVLLHCGDFTDTGQAKQVRDFTKWLLEAKINQGYSHVVVIAGNHDITFDEPYYVDRGAAFFHKKSAIENSTSVKTKQILTTLTLDESNEPTNKVNDDGDGGGRKVFNSHETAVIMNGTGIVGANGIIYLEDGFVQLQHVSKHASETLVTQIYGSPYQPEFCDWAFNLRRGEPCQLKWEEIPALLNHGETGAQPDGEVRSVDVLLTHGPPLGRGDKLYPSRNRSGCVDLLSRVQNFVKPLLHVFGHIHEGAGEVSSDGITTYANASTCNFHYQSINPPLVFDLIFGDEEIDQTSENKIPSRPQEVVQIDSRVNEWSIEEVDNWLQSLKQEENNITRDDEEDGIVNKTSGQAEEESTSSLMMNRNNMFPQRAIKSLKGLDGAELLKLHPDDKRLRDFTRLKKVEVIRAIRHIGARLFDA